MDKKGMKSFCCAHGTSRPCAKSIAMDGFRPGITGDFGPACYFFPCTKYGRKQAKAWAESDAGRMKASQMGSTAIVAAMVAVPVDSIIDLDNSKDRENVYRTSRDIARQYGHDPGLQKAQMKRHLNYVCGKRSEEQKCNYAKAFIISPFPPLDGSPQILYSKDVCYVLKDCPSGVIICADGCDNV